MVWSAGSGANREDHHVEEARRDGRRIYMVSPIVGVSTQQRPGLLSDQSGRELVADRSM
jgi:hypothetical protein